MLHLSVETEEPKGWLVGPWNSDLPVSAGYANEGVNEEHYHFRMYEVYLVADPVYQERKKQRFRVEQPFGIAKAWHGFERNRYLGLARYRIQALLTFMVLNAKRLVKLLTGVAFRPQAKGRHAERLKPLLVMIP